MPDEAPRRTLSTPKPVAGARAAAEILRAVRLQTEAQVRAYFAADRERYEPILDALEEAAELVDDAAEQAWWAHNDAKKTTPAPKEAPAE